jgi:lipoyl(octanoyl) transferase
VEFPRLQLWIDPVSRPGPQAMAVDEWLLGVATMPVLRVYRWLGDWCSLGYFGNLEVARAALPGADWVRRMTGGGVVDHRADWTYSLIVPAETGPALWKGAESYCRIHTALAAALRMEGIAARMSGGGGGSGHPLCFRNPVCHDLVDPGGAKLAGAGQRRTRHGLLHQGSVAAPCGATASRVRGEHLATGLSAAVEPGDFLPPDDVLAGITATRYANPAWLFRK